MKISAFKVFLPFLVTLLLVPVAVADRIELRDGRVLHGKFLDGTQQSIRFRVNGEVQEFPLSEVVAITFGADGGTQTQAATAHSPSQPAQPRRRLSGPVTVPAGTTILVRMIDTVDSEKNQIGDRFRASLETDLVVDGVVVVPKGTDVYGRLTEVKEAGRVAGRSELKLELTDILIGQQLQPIVTSDYELAGESRGKDTAKKVGGAAAIGAIIGAVAGGGKGAAIGAGVGAGAGTAIQVLTRGQQVHVPSETLLEFRLEQPFTVRPSR
ncbi:MAG: hypothetical protein K6U09_04630 [Acidobacteriia bacterium]|jgi:hypothetical protein|nr:hypothetical protein [Terriglobia bacterium]